MLSNEAVTALAALGGVAVTTLGGIAIHFLTLRSTAQRARDELLAQRRVDLIERLAAAISEVGDMVDHHEMGHYPTTAGGANGLDADVAMAGLYLEADTVDALTSWLALRDEMLRHPGHELVNTTISFKEMLGKLRGELKRLPGK